MRPGGSAASRPFPLSAQKESRKIMRSIKVVAPYEPIEVTIGDVVVKIRVNTTIDGILDLSEACQKAYQKIKPLVKLQKDAEASKDTKKIREFNNKIADVLEVPIKAGIGVEGYDALYSACAQDGPIKKADCNIVMMEVFRQIYEISQEYRNTQLNKKAAHYLAEVQDAQSEPNTED